MAFPDEVVTAAKVATSHLKFTINGTGNSSFSPYSKTLANVRNFGELDFAGEQYAHMGHNADGAAQIAAVFETVEGSGVFEFDLNEVYDVDGEAWTGDQLDVSISGVYQKNATKGWSVTAAKAFVQIIKFTPREGEDALCRVRVTPYNSPGTATWLFDDDITV